MAWDDDREDTTLYRVVVNREEHYSIWPAHRENPLGWNDVGKSGPKQEAWTTSRKSGPTCALFRSARRWRRWSASGRPTRVPTSLVLS